LEKIIAIDFDGVISNPYHLKLKYLQEFGYNISLNQTTYGQCVKNGIVKEEHYKIANQRALAAGPESVFLERDFIKYYKKLLNLPFDLFIITSRSDSDMDVLHKILDYHSIKLAGVINTNNHNKYDALCDISADIFIEDNSFFIMEIIKAISLNNNDNNMQIVFYINEVNVNESINNSSIIEVQGWKKLYKYLIRESTIK